jgi:hypothetical protein
MKFIAVVCVLLLVGTACSRRDPGPPSQGHHHHAPHGGMLVELGPHQFNLELKFDDSRGVLQAWLLDGHAENFVRTDMPGFVAEARSGETARTLQFVAVANSMSGETVGDTSYFEAPAEWLRSAKAFDGRINEITVRGVRFTDFTFSFAHHDEKQDHAAHK